MSRGGAVERLATTTSRPRRLGPRARKGALLVHIASGGAWIGIDIVMGVLVFTAVVTDDEAVKALCLQALELFAIWPLVIAGLVCLVSGVVLGLGTKYGLLRYWWVSIKLVINVVLVVLVVVLLRPGVMEAAEQGRMFMDGQVVSLLVGDLIFPPVVSTSALVVAMVLSVFKPWGLIRKRGPSKADALLATGRKRRGGRGIEDDSS